MNVHQPLKGKCMTVDFTPLIWLFSTALNLQQIWCEVSFWLHFCSFSPEKCIHFGIIWAKSATLCVHCFPFIQVWNGSNWAIFKHISLQFNPRQRAVLNNYKDQNSSGKECCFIRNGTNLVIQSTFVLNINWAELATKNEPIFFLPEGTKWLKKG